jgi:predicted dehydrogenase
MTLRAVVIGTGWAGEGHTIALREAGVEVVAMCGRTPEAAKAMATKLGIDEVHFDWRQGLEALHPDIVSIATTAAPHREMVEFAAHLGSHIMCDKPLGVNAEEARAMLAAVEQAGVKHAYGSTSRYGPACRYARHLLAEGLIGQVHEIESVFHFRGTPLVPYSWLHRLELGGGLLNNFLPHKFDQVLYMTGGKALAAAGEARCLRERAPVGPAIHDFRTIFGQIVEPDEKTEWREANADTTFTVTVQMEMPDGSAASALFRGSATAVCRNPHYLAFYGEEGTLHMSHSSFSQAPDSLEYFDPKAGEWQALPIPSQIMASLPQVDDVVQRDWNQLFHEFVADVQGEGNAGYSTFHEGWLHNEIIDIVRSGRGWTPTQAKPRS